MSTLLEKHPPRRARLALPRLGFLGVGWIGRNRLATLARSGLGEVAAVADTVEENLAEARAIAPQAASARSLDELLEMELDALVIATPSALHAEQAIAALEHGLAVFCQKPLARTRAETEAVIAAARRADRLLAVDLSYRHTSGMSAIRALAQEGAIGAIYAADLVFHNAYGPDKPWFYDSKLSGGGCLIDLGIHLADLALWVLEPAQVLRAEGRLFVEGKPLGRNSAKVEDFATARIDLDTGAAVQLACSWRLPAGCDAVISASFYGTRGGLKFQNVGGSFYEFQAERTWGTRGEVLARDAEDWGGRAALDWLRRLGAGQGHDPAVEALGAVAGAIDQIYGRA